MGHSISILKAQYFKTDMRLANFLNYIHFPLRHIDEGQWKYKEEYLNPYLEKMHNEPQFKYKKDWYKIPDYSTYHFQQALENNDMDYLYKNYEYHHDYKKTTNWSHNTVLFDGFCGCAEWLTSFREFKGMSNTFTIGIELVKERADICKENKVDLLFNDAFENVETIPNSCSIIYFNPPYDNIKLEDGSYERLTKTYLKQIIEKDLLETDGLMDLVIREDDFIDCLDLLHEHFIINPDLMFKAPQDEYNKFKQLLIIAQKRKSPFSQNSMSEYWRNQALESKLSLNERAKNCPIIDVTKITIDKLLELRGDIPVININTKLKLFKQKKKSENMISNSKDNIWNWFKEKTIIKENQIKDLVTALPLKTGEMANMLASGILDGSISKGTERNHIVVGGVEQVKDVKTSFTYDINNKKIESIIVQKLNKPYLNILTAEGKIIKLINKEIKVVESEEDDIE